MPSVISAGTTSGTSLNLSADTSGVLQLATNGTTTAVTIDTSQNVGIGTASPATQLQMNSGASTYSDQLRIRNTNFGNADIGVGSGVMALATDMSNITFYTSSSLGTTGSALPTNERMRIDGSGNVGIGTASPSSIIGGRCLTLYNTGTATLSVQAVDGGNDRYATLELLSSGNGGSYAQILFGDTDTTPGTSSPLVFASYYSSTRTERMRLNTTGNLVLQGGTTTANGVGITFPATQSASSDANCLDDYEEGTWTPTIVGSSTAGTTTYSFQAGKYTKVGNLVTISCNVLWTSATGTGSLLLAGFPFTTTNQAGINPNGGVMMERVDLPNGTANITTYVEGSNTRSYFYCTLDNAGWAPVAMDSNGEIYATVTYFTT